MEKKFNPRALLKDPNQIYNEIANEVFPDGKKAFWSEIDRSMVKTIQLYPDISVAAAIFKPHPQKCNIFYAHPLTIEAVKKEIFLAGENSEFLSQPYVCTSCKKNVDLQFWNFCPYCGGNFLL